MPSKFLNLLSNRCKKWPHPPPTSIAGLNLPHEPSSTIATAASPSRAVIAFPNCSSRTAGCVLKQLPNARRSRVLRVLEVPGDHPFLHGLRELAQRGISVIRYMPDEGGDRVGMVDMDDHGQCSIVEPRLSIGQVHAASLPAC